MNTLPKLTLILTGISIIVSCTSNEQDTEKLTLKPADVKTDTNTTRVSESIDFMLPRPFALISSFEKSGIDFETSRMNDPYNVNEYTNEGKQLMNFGVYSADLVYSIINDQPQASINNFNAIRELGEKLGMSSVFAEEELIQKIEENIADREAMEELLIDLHEKSQEYLASNEMRSLAAIQFSGAWIEGMYLATFELDKKDTLLISNNIVNHMTLLEHVVKAIENYTHRNNDLNEVFAEIKKLQTTYNNLESIKNAQSFPELNQEEVETIAGKIYAIRQLVIA